MIGKCNLICNNQTSEGKCNLICDNKTSEGYCKHTGMCSKYFSTTSTLYPNNNHTFRDSYYNNHSTICGNCLYRSTEVYTSDPLQIKCCITNRFHFMNDVCDCSNDEISKYIGINHLDEASSKINIEIKGDSDSMNNKTKLYRIEFLRYTNVMKDTVSDMKDGDYKITGNERYLDARDLIVREQDLEYYRQFGGGFKSIEFVGYLGEPLEKK